MRNMKKPSKSDTVGRLYGGETSEDRTQRRKAQFLDAGLQLFGTVGYKAASVRALCREAKLTDRYFYESFKSVEDVLVAVYEREIQRLVAAVLQAVPSISSQERIADMARPALQAFFKGVQDPVVAKTIWFEVLGVSDRVNKVYQSTIHDIGDLLLQMVKNYFPDLCMNRQRETLLSIGIVGAISQSTMAWIISGFNASIDDLVEVNLLLLEGLGLRLKSN